MRTFLIVFAIGLAVTAADDVKDPVLNVVEVALRMGQYSYLMALEETNSLDLLLNTKDITVFMPTNDAFRNVSEDTRNFWRAHPDYYKQLMRYHIVGERRDKKDLIDEANYDTLADKKRARYIDYNGFSKNIQLYNDAQIQSFNYEASNGVIHLLDNVVGHIQNDNMLSIVQGRPELSKILNAVKITNLTTVLNGSGPYTFAAPTDQAIGKLPAGAWDKLLNDTTQLKEILNFHIASAGTWMTRGLTDKLSIATLNKNANWTISIMDNQPITIWNDKATPTSRAQLVTSDLSALNGVVHTIDTVLFLPGQEEL